MNPVIQRARGRRFIAACYTPFTFRALLSKPRTQFPGIELKASRIGGFPLT